MDATISNKKMIKTFIKSISELKKIGTDVTFVICENDLSIQCINNTQTILPIIKFNASAFSEYDYLSNRPRITLQIVASNFCSCFRHISSPTKLVIRIDEETQSLHFHVYDRFGIIHHVNIFTSKARGRFITAQSVKTLFISIDAKQLLKTQKSFKSAYIGLSADYSGENEQISFRSYCDEKNGTSKLIMRQSCLCEIKIEKNGTKPVLFSSTDFVMALRIAKLANETAEFNVSAPGMPLLVTATNKMNSVSVECSLATMTEANQDSVLPFEGEEKSDE
ncbi:hypothetical protein GPJ56_002484 [Histomonas meleagridis]|uniref:uncharacterized protein n=1 Tax=Histomonas meleagridis TaxID=135588 RepID=UPI0035595122|nr:hypothetical protein GPJ56_002484 [Histomonas meleagridis]KAH0801795.1 hypothetical protein GO595_005476 [Histomonas meleagridis]